jgi:hypothetical protein
MGLYMFSSTRPGSQSGTSLGGRVHLLLDVRVCKCQPSNSLQAGPLLADSAAAQQDPEGLPCAYMEPSCIAVRAGSLCSAAWGLCWCMTPVGWVMPGWVAVVFMPEGISSLRSRPCICAGMCRGCPSEDTILPPGMSDILSCWSLEMCSKASSGEGSSSVALMQSRQNFGCEFEMVWVRKQRMRVGYFYNLC